MFSLNYKTNVNTFSPYVSLDTIWLSQSLKTILELFTDDDNLCCHVLSLHKIIKTKKTKQKLLGPSPLNFLSYIGTQKSNNIFIHQEFETNDSFKQVCYFFSTHLYFVEQNIKIIIFKYLFKLGIPFVPF